jgi:hypothetical protein
LTVVDVVVSTVTVLALIYFWMTGGLGSSDSP